VVVGHVDKLEALLRPRDRSDHKGANASCEAYVEHRANDMAQLGVKVTDEADS
jgi:hypothetical protein